MQYSKILYFAVIAFLAILALLFEWDVLPRAIVPDDPTLTYVLNLLTVVLSLGGCFLLLYWFRIPAIAQRRASLTDTALATFDERQHLVRIILWGLLTCVHVLCYYLAPYAHNALYGILILLAAGIFCWPTSEK